jgi:predicted phage terminase large subunit-like protein
MAAMQYADVPGYSALLIRDTLQNLSQPKALMDIAFTWFINTDAEWNDKKKTWYFPCEDGGYSRLRFGYLDGPRDHFNYQGGENHFIGIDEAVNIRENQANFLFGWLRKEKGFPVPLRYRCASNPPLPEQASRGAWVKRKYVDIDTKDKDTVFIPAYISDNEHIDEVQYDISLSKLDPITREKIKKGDWEISLQGDMFRREWFKVVDRAPVTATKVRFWDLAGTEKNENNNPCYTVGLLMSKDENRQYFIEDVVRIMAEPAGVEKAIKLTATLDGRETYVKMEQEPGSSGKAVIDHYRRDVLHEYHFEGIKPTGSKIVRARPVSSQIDAGNVVLVKGKWNKDFIDEAVLFPNSEYLDQVDALSGAYTALSSGGIFRTRII